MIRLRLKGITQLGKNRIKEHGDIWKVDPEFDFSIEMTIQHKILLESEKDGYLKWGPAPDFEIIEQPKENERKNLYQE